MKIRLESENYQIVIIMAILCEVACILNHYCLFTSIEVDS